MNTVVLLCGLVIGMIATGLVAADTTRRNLSSRTQWLWIGFVGSVSIGSAVAMNFLDNTLYRLYLGITDSPAIAPLPRDLAIGILLVVLGVSAVAVLGYGFGSRYGPLKVA